jgi:hypothetical protein
VVLKFLTQGVINITNIYIPMNRASKYMKKNWQEFRKK